MLDLENIDDVGLCSRFFARLPTADIVFTEVGRYHPLTNRPPLRAGERYLVYRNAKYLITLTERLRVANTGHVPAALLGGHYRLALRSRHEVLYERAGAAAERVNLQDFLENLAHPARLRLAVWQGVPLDRRDVLEKLPFLAGGRATFSLSGSLALEVHLPEDPTYQLWFDSIVSSQDADLEIALYDKQGSVLSREMLHLPAGTPIRYHRVLERPGRATVFTMKLTQVHGEATVSIEDVRVLGQPPGLRRYLETELLHTRR